MGMFALLLLVAFNVISILAAPDDKKQVAEAIEEMRKATLENRAGGVLEHLSNAFETPVGSETGSPLASVGNFITNAKVSRLVISDVNTEIDGASAITECKMDADVEFLQVRYRLNGPVKIEFRKETAYRLFVIPEKKWRVVRFYPVDMSQFQAGPIS